MLEREVRRGQQARGTHLIKLLGYNIEPTNEVPYIIYELAPGGSLEDELQRLRTSGQRMPLTLVLVRLADLLLAVGTITVIGMSALSHDTLQFAMDMCSVHDVFVEIALRDDSTPTVIAGYVATHRVEAFVDGFAKKIGRPLTFRVHDPHHPDGPMTFESTIGPKTVSPLN